MKPAPRHISCEIAFLALFAATLAGNWGGMREFAERCVDDASEWGGRNFRGNGEHTDAFRDIAEKFVTSGETLYYCANGVGGRLQPAERSTHLALSWARSPDPVAFGSADGAGKSSAIIASRFLKVDFPGYTHIVGNGNANLWLRDDIAADGSGDEDGREPTAPSPWREAAGTLVACALIAVFAWQMRTAGIEKKETSFGVASRVSPAICATAFFMLAAAAALTHTFMAPTGLGVHGGKAKLFYLAGGIPGGFFTDPAFSSYQPAYPPGFALLTLLSYWVSGGCGEWLTQLVPVFAAAAALWLTAGGGAVSRIAALWILAAFLNQQTLQMATLYYAEPFVALLVLLGWKRLQENRTDRRGWVLIGAAGFFKTEGLILLSVAWTVYMVCEIRCSKGTREAINVFRSGVGRFAAAAAAPAAWHIVCRLAGAMFYDYAPVWSPDWSKFRLALGYLLKLAFLEPWRYGFAYSVAALVLALPLICRKPHWHPPSGLRAAAIAALVCLATFAFVYSLSLAPNFDWHLRTSAARLLWVPSLPILASFCTALSKSRPTPNELRAERTATAAADTTCRTFFDPCGRMAAPASANASFAWNPGAWARQAH